MREAREGIPFSHDRTEQRRPFACAPYVLVGSGSAPAMAGQVSDRCPSAADGERCSVTKDGHRRRATGPGFPLQVLRCGTHGHFTVYPMGWVPYGRTAVVPVSVSGDLLRAEAAAPLAKWRQTVFEAPVAVSTGPAWHRELGRADALQRRHTVKAGDILGLSPDIDTVTAEQIRGGLGLAGLDHDKARRDFAGTEDHLGRARAIVPLLGSLVIDGSLCHRVLRAGYLAGVWGRPLMLDVPTTGAFPPPGTHPGPMAQKAREAPHESVADPPGDPPKLPSLASPARQVAPRCTDMPSG